MVRHFPRPVKPELIEPGDVIEVEYKPTDGLTTIHRGVVHRIETNGINRFLMTEQGAIIGVWSPNMKVDASFTLINRSYGGELLDFFVEVGRL